MSQQSQTVLVFKSAVGDPIAFEQLLSRKRKLIVFKIKTMIDDPNDAEDIAQEVAIRLFQHIRSLREPEAFNGWLNTIVKRECLKYYTMKEKLVLTESIIENDDYESGLFETDTDFLPDAYAERTELMGKIKTALACLSDKDRKMFLLHYEKGKRYREIAALMGISISAVCSYLSRARKRLQRELVNVL